MPLVGLRLAGFRPGREIDRTMLIGLETFIPGDIGQDGSHPGPDDRRSSARNTPFGNDALLCNNHF
jgi:hypothetical protein